jgi:hypothetical protein
VYVINVSTVMSTHHYCHIQCLIWICNTCTCIMKCDLMSCTAQGNKERRRMLCCFKMTMFFGPGLTIECLPCHFIFYVTRFSIGWKIGVIFYHPKKIDLWRICSNVAQYPSAIEYSAETNHKTCKVLLHNIYVFDIIKW